MRGNRNQKKPDSKPKPEKKGKGKNSKNNRNKADKNRKFVNKNPDKNPSKENEEKIKNRLAKLGLTKMPTPSTMSGLECLWDELENLLWLVLRILPPPILEFSKYQETVFKH